MDRAPGPGLEARGAALGGVLPGHFCGVPGNYAVHLLCDRGGGFDRLQVLGGGGQAGDRVCVWADVSSTLTPRTLTKVLNPTPEE